MACLFSFPILGEPDIQRLPSLLLEAVKRLGGSVFPVSVRIPALNQHLRDAFRQEEDTLYTSLTLEKNTLRLRWKKESFPLVMHIRPPQHLDMEKLCQDFQDKIRTSNPELLRMHNENIRKKLKKAQQDAQREIRDIEQQLLHRKKELDLYIQKAETDSLTGILNRGAYDRILHETLRNPSLPFSLIFLDLDYFKEVNDTFGHAYGDEVLRSMALSMRSAIREGRDMACRIGGDEFAILLFADIHQAERIGCAILADMDQKVSIGISTCKEGDTPESLAHRADKSLYHAKENGRGQVVCLEKNENFLECPGPG